MKRVPLLAALVVIVGCASTEPAPPLAIELPIAPDARAVVSAAASAIAGRAGRTRDAATRCGEAATTTRLRIQAWKVEGAKTDGFPVEDITACVPFDGGVATIRFAGAGELEELPSVGRCPRERIELVAFHDDGSDATQPLVDNLVCSYAPTLGVYDWGGDGARVLALREQGLELGDQVLQRLQYIDRARIVVARVGGFAPWKGIEPFAAFADRLGKPELPSVEPSIAITRVDGADGPFLTYEILRVRLIDCGLRDWLSCTSMPGLGVMSAPTDAGNGPRFVGLPDTSVGERKDALLCGLTPVGTPPPGYLAAYDVFDAFCKEATSAKPKPIPAATWKRLRKKHCADADRCFYFDEAEHATNRMLDALAP